MMLFYYVFYIVSQLLATSETDRDTYPMYVRILDISTADVTIDQLLEGQKVAGQDSGGLYRLQEGNTGNGSFPKVI